MLRVDLEKRTVEASVLDLIARPDEVPRPGGPLGAARTALGTTVHQAYRGRRAAGVPGFLSERPVGFQTEVDGFAVTVRGRVDGCWRGEDGTWVLEEVKSVEADARRLARLAEKDLPDAALQARLYALALEGEMAPAIVRPRLVAISVVDGAERAIDLPFERESATRRVATLVRRHVKAARAARRRAKARRRVAAALRFPYGAPRPGQAALSKAAAAALEAGRPLLAQAPTGVGKTIAVLLPGLQYALSMGSLLFYCTAKNTQQALVARTFEDVVEAAGEAGRALRALTLREKRSMCPPGTLLCHPEKCPFLRRFLQRKRREAALARLLDEGPHVAPDRIHEVGEAETLCPYGLALALIPRVDLVIGDVNYVYDQDVAPDLGVPCAVVVDEAHTLFDRAREHVSLWLPAKVPVRVRGAPALAKDLKALLARVQEAVSEVAALAAADDVDEIEGCRACRPPVDPWHALASDAALLLLRYAVHQLAHGGSHPDDPVIGALRTVMRVRDALAADRPELLPYVATGTDAPNGPGFGVLCVNPAPHLVERHGRVRGPIAISATLSPLDWQADVLGLAPLEPLRLEVPDPFPPENRCVVVDPSVGTTYRERQASAEGIARRIEGVFAARAGNHVAFFPSFAFLEAVKEHLQVPAESLLVQTRRSPPETRQAVLKALSRADRPRLLLAVTGGVFAEGVDLPGEALVGAIVVGPALPGIGFERTAIESYFDATRRAGFAYAFAFPGMQRVIQAAGRVHRSPEDVGVIVLLGRRFAGPPYADLLPRAWYRERPDELITRDAVDAVARFWAAVRPAQGLGTGV